MPFALGLRSKLRLKGVDPKLVAVVKRAIEISEIDFSVIEGLRTRERQAELVKSGASKTLSSKHIVGRAVDLAPYIGGTIRFEWEPIFTIACAMDQAATELGVALRWGGVWDRLMSQYGGSPAAMRKAVDDYCTRHPGPDFIDGPHYELA